ncbi:MAG TPA: TonB-dependent receptor [Terriglobales bacterium]|nr:TonB-dependent receptor [Terriglobales bacterium]
MRKFTIFSMAVLLYGGAAALRAQAPPGPVVLSGRVLSGRTPLPGVTIVAASAALHRRFITATGVDGSFELHLPAPGRYALRATFAGFAPSGQTIAVAAGRSRVLIEMTLLARLQAAAGAPARAGAGADLGAAGPQNLTLQDNEAGGGAGFSNLEEGNAANLAGGAAVPGLNGAADTSTEAVTIAGRMGQTEPGMLSPGAERRFARFRQNGPGGPPGRGGPGGFRGGPMIFIARRRGGFDFNRPHGSLYYSLADSALDARPFALTGVPAPKPAFLQQRFGFAVGSPLVIPKLVNSPKTFVFLNVTGNHSSSPFTAFSTVPTVAERAGDFSGATTRAGQPIVLYDPATGQPLANDAVPAISPVAQALLPFIPAPNLPGAAQNFYYATTSKTSSDEAALRLMHNFGPAPAGFGRGGARNNLSLAVNYSGSRDAQPNALPTIAGLTRSRGLNVNVGYVRGAGRVTNIMRVVFNRQRVETTNLYAFVQNVAGAAGITGIAAAPFDWGLPGLAFSSFTSLNDVAPSLVRNQTGSFSDFVIWFHGKHFWRFGGDFRRLQVNPETDANPRGSFVFSGLYTARLVNGAPAPGTGSDFADFLLGEAQQASVNFGAGAEYFRGDSWDLFAQDNWRARGNFTLNWGLRYEFVSPLTEKYNRLANLDLQFASSSALAAVAPVLAGGLGPYSGRLPLALIRPDRGGFEPRFGFAWSPLRNTVLRGGYGININTGAYASLATQLAAQPPYATSQTVIGAVAAPVAMAAAFTPPAPGVITNGFAVDPNYRLGYVQLWNLDLQRQLRPTLLLNFDYSGSKGTNLDQTLAPNRGPLGLLLPGVDAFLWETSGGDSILHAGSVRLRKRLQGGFALGGTYTWAKSIDDASTIGGGATVVAQNPLDLAAERGLSSFDVRQRLTGDFDYELPWGPERRWLAGDSWAARVFGQWQWSGDFTIASGTPLTPRVLGNPGDVARGTNGTLRPNLTGRPLAVAAPSIAEFFNTAAFAVPPPGEFGDAGRNIIPGPGSLVFNFALSKTIALGEYRMLELRLEANNVFNTPQWTGVDTVVNSPTFGQVTAAGPMRAMQLLARYRF